MVAPHTLGQLGTGGWGLDNRQFVNAVVYPVRTGVARPVRAIRPLEHSGASASTKAGVWPALVEALQKPDHARVLFYSTTVKAYKAAVGAQALGRSRGGLSTEVHTVADALGNSLDLLGLLAALPVARW